GGRAPRPSAPRMPPPARSGRWRAARGSRPARRACRAAARVAPPPAVAPTARRRPRRRPPPPGAAPARALARGGARRGARPLVPLPLQVQIDAEVRAHPADDVLVVELEPGRERVRELVADHAAVTPRGQTFQHLQVE